MLNLRTFPWLFSVLLVLISTGIVLIALPIGRSMARHDTAPSELAPTPTAKPATFSCLGTIDLEGGVTALNFLQPGRVKKILVKEGQLVAAGTVLVELEDDLARHRFEEAQSTLASARAQREQAVEGIQTHRQQLVQQEAARAAMSERLEASRSLLSRKEELLRINQASTLEVSAASHQVQELVDLEKAEQAKLAELRLRDPLLVVHGSDLQIDLMQSRLKQAQDALEEGKLKAPCAGSVLRILTSPGDVVGGPNQAAVLQFVADVPRLVRAEVEQEFVGRVRQGQKVMVQDDTNATQNWTGEVTRVSNWVAPRRTILQEGPEPRDVRTVEVVIKLDSGSVQPRLGLRVLVTIQAETR